MADQTKYRLNEITKIENYFIEETNQRKTSSKRLSKCVAAFDYIDKVLIFLRATCGVVCIISSLSVVGAPVQKENKKKMHDKIFMLAKSKLNSIETLVSQALIYIEICHEEFDTIMKGKNMSR